MPSGSVALASSAADIEAVKSVFKDYLGFISDTLGNDLCFQGTETEFATFPDIYDALFVAKVDSAVVGACGLKPFPERGSCELKRLYVRPEGRGHGFGQILTEHCIRAGRNKGYAKMYLDTNPTLKHANHIYETLGFVDIPAYYDNPMLGTRYMALDLKAH